MLKNEFHELIYDLTGYNEKKINRAENAILKMGADSALLMEEAIEQRKIPASRAYKTLLKLDPQHREKIFSNVNPENIKDLLNAIYSHKKAVPELIPFAKELLNRQESTLVCLETLFEIHHKIEIQCPEYLDEYLLITDELFDLVNHTEAESYWAMLIIALVRPDPQTAIPIIINCLDNANPRDLVFNASLSTLGSYGKAAEGATDTLLQLIFTSSGYEIQIAELLAKIGATPEKAIPIIQKVIESMEFSSDAHEKSFKQSIDMQIVAINQQRQDKPNFSKVKYSPVLDDFLTRLNSGENGIYSSANSVRWKAYGELDLYSDPIIIPQIKKALDKRISKKDFNRIVLILGYVTRNSQSTEGKELIRSLLGRPKLSNPQLIEIIRSAGRAGLVDLAPTILNLAITNAAIEDSVRDFLEDTKYDSEIDLLKTLVTNSSEKHSRLLWIFTLQEIGSPAVLPILEGFARRAYASKRKAEFEWRYYSINAMGKIGSDKPVPLLLELLNDKNYLDVKYILIKSLCMLGGKDILPIITKEIEQYILNEQFVSRWSNGYLTPIVNAFGYFDDVGAEREESVLSLAHKLHSESWDKLYQEEQLFLIRIYPEFEPEPEPEPEPGLENFTNSINNDDDSIFRKIKGLLKSFFRDPEK